VGNLYFFGLYYFKRIDSNNLSIIKIKMVEKNVTERVIETLENNSGQVFSKTELRDLLEVSDRLIVRVLKTLLKHNEINGENISVRVARRIFSTNNIKRGMRLYYIE